MVEAGEELAAPHGQSATEAGDLGHWAGLGRGDDLFHGGAAGGQVGLGVRGHQVLRDEPGGGDLPARVAGVERGVDLRALLGGELVTAPAQQPAGAEQRPGGGSR